MASRLQCMAPGQYPLCTGFLDLIILSERNKQVSIVPAKALEFVMAKHTLIDSIKDLGNEHNIIIMMGMY